MSTTAPKEIPAINTRSTEGPRTVEVVGLPDVYDLIRAIEANNPNAFIIGGSMAAAEEIYKTKRNTYRNEDELKGDYVAKFNELAMRLYRDAIFNCKGTARIVWRGLRFAGSQSILEYTVQDTNLPESGGSNLHGMSTSQAFSMGCLLWDDGKASLHG